MTPSHYNNDTGGGERRVDFSEGGCGVVRPGRKGGRIKDVTQRLPLHKKCNRSKIGAQKKKGGVGGRHPNWGAARRRGTKEGRGESEKKGLLAPCLNLLKMVGTNTRKGRLTKERRRTREKAHVQRSRSTGPLGDGRFNCASAGDYRGHSPLRKKRERGGSSDQARS